MAYKPSLTDRLNELKPDRVNLEESEPQPTLNKQTYTLNIHATEKQMKHMEGHMRMLKIKFEHVSL